MDDIQRAQVEAAEKVVVERLRQKGLLPPSPSAHVIANRHPLELSVDVVCDPCGSLIGAQWVVRDEAPKQAVLCVESCRCTAPRPWRPIDTGGEVMSAEFDPETDRTLREIAEDIAVSIKNGATNWHLTADLLIEFAEEIKRQAVEP